jgi:lipoprotein-anchoring transpeptidase ErfK/SrfK
MVLLGAMGWATSAAFAQQGGIDDYFDEDGNFIGQPDPFEDQPRSAPQPVPAQPQAGFERPESDYRDPSLFPPAESETEFPIQPANLKKVPKKFHRQISSYAGPEWPGTIIVDPQERHLYLVLEGGKAIRYGVGVGRAGFEWSGRAKVGMKRRWPRWLPPLEMVARDKNAAKWVNGQPGGPDNPLGARALYLYANGQDTLYRIHGTNDPSSIGKAMSSGCIRMLNEDVADLYRRVPVGTEVLVMGQRTPAAASASAN